MLTVRKCPNCGGGRIVKTEDGITCLNCGAMFDNENEYTITSTVTYRDEAKIEEVKAKERSEIRDNRVGIRLLIGWLVVIAIIGLIIALGENNKTTAPVDSANALKNKPVDVVINTMKDAGFKNVESIPLNDLKPGDEKQENLVSTVTIEGEENWKEGNIISSSFKSYSKSAPVKVYYHSENPDAVIPAPEGNGTIYRGMDYESVQKKMRDAGFTDIVSEPLKDLETADDNLNGKVDYVTIDGETEWSEGFLQSARKQFNRNKPVVVYYHSD